MTDTTLLSRFKFVGDLSQRQLATFKHGQYKGADVHGTFGASNNRGDAEQDDHHSPLHAAEYIMFRIEPTLDFYQRRLPRYYRSRTVIQYLLLLGTFSSTLLAFFGVGTWAAIPTAIATAATAWQEFAGTDKKLSRYSGAVQNLGELTIWWKQLSDVEKANTSNLHGLILSCEEVLEKEREAWLSTSMATKLLSESSGQDRAGSRDAGGGEKAKTPEPTAN
jgi:hypothetical protein